MIIIIGETYIWGCNVKYVILKTFIMIYLIMIYNIQYTWMNLNRVSKQNLCNHLQVIRRMLCSSVCQYLANDIYSRFIISKHNKIDDVIKATFHTKVDFTQTLKSRSVRSLRWWCNVCLRKRGKGLVRCQYGIDAGKPGLLTQINCPNSKVHGANIGPTWVLSAPGGPHVGLMNLAIWVML